MNTICQSCGMQLTEELRGTEADKTSSGDYCHYCYQDGAFAKEETMEEMIESCIPFRINDTDCPNADVARSQMGRDFPHLKRWSNYS